MMGLSYPLSLLMVFMVLLFPSSAYAVETEIPRAENLAQIARSSAQQRLPVVVFVSRDACPYCRTLRNSVLVPMHAAGRFENRAILVEVNVDQTVPLTGFDGEPVNAKDFAEQYRARITPTLLFLDEHGKQLSKPRVGISNLELYGFYLNQSIDESLARLAGPD